MSILRTFWFWLFIIGIILAAVGLIIYAARKEWEWWNTLLVAGGGVLILIGIIWWNIEDVDKEKEEREEKMGRGTGTMDTMRSSCPEGYVPVREVDGRRVAVVRQNEAGDKEVVTGKRVVPVTKPVPKMVSKPEKSSACFEKPMVTKVPKESGAKGKVKCVPASSLAKAGPTMAPAVIPPPKSTIVFQQSVTPKLEPVQPARPLPPTRRLGPSINSPRPLTRQSFRSVAQYEPPMTTTYGSAYNPSTMATYGSGPMTR
jgi:hypothetical protein